MPTPVLDIRNLSVSYEIGERHPRAVDSLSLTLAAGERLGIVGESGSGKSTLALALMRLHKAPARIDGGEIHIGGVNILKLNSEALRRFRWNEISFIPQGAMNSLNPVMKVKAQMADTILAHRKSWSSKQIQIHVESLLERVGLDRKIADLYPHELSGGMKQRVCIALAIVLEPKLIVADEPTSALDVVVQRVVVETLKEVQAQIGAAMIMIGHDMGLMAQSVDQLAVMYAGRLVDVAPIREFFLDPLHPYSQLLISSLPSPDQIKPLAGIPGTQPSLLNLPSGCAFHPRCPLVREHCQTVVPVAVDVVKGRRVACHVVAEKFHV